MSEYTYISPLGMSSLGDGTQFIEYDSTEWTNIQGLCVTHIFYMIFNMFKREGVQNIESPDVADKPAKRRKLDLETTLDSETIPKTILSGLQFYIYFGLIIVLTNLNSSKEIISSPYPIPSKFQTNNNIQLLWNDNNSTKLDTSAIDSNRLNECNTQYIVLLLSLVSSEGGDNHQNCIIIDRINEQFIRIEPNINNPEQGNPEVYKQWEKRYKLTKLDDELNDPSGHFARNILNKIPKLNNISPYNEVSLEQLYQTTLQKFKKTVEVGGLLEQADEAKLRILRFNNALTYECLLILLELRDANQHGLRSTTTIPNEILNWNEIKRAIDNTRLNSDAFTRKLITNNLMYLANEGLNRGYWSKDKQEILFSTKGYKHLKGGKPKTKKRRYKRRKKSKRRRRRRRRKSRKKLN